MQHTQSARRIVHLLLAAATLLAALIIVLVGASDARADVGDGNPACNSGEICLDVANPSGCFQRHFYYSGNEDGTFTNVCSGGSTTTPVHDNASSVWNRDTQCNVTVFDYYPGTSNPRNNQTFARQDPGFRGFRSDMNDKNDAHKRVGYSGCS